MTRALSQHIATSIINCTITTCSINWNYLELYTLDISTLTWHVRALWSNSSQLSHRRTIANLVSFLSSFSRLSCSNCRSVFFWAKIFYVSSILSVPPGRTRVFLALRRLLRTPLVLRTLRTSANIRIISWAIASIPLAMCLTASKMGVEELSWWPRTRNNNTAWNHAHHKARLVEVI